MSRRSKAPKSGDAEVTERLKAERIQQRLKAERIQEPLADEGDTIFRETFLCRIRRPEDADALRLLGSLALTVADRAGYLKARTDRVAASELAGAAADLRRLSASLQSMAGGIERKEVGAREARLGERARDWARVTADLANEIQAEIDLAP